MRQMIYFHYLCAQFNITFIMPNSRAGDTLDMRPLVTVVLSSCLWLSISHGASLDTEKDHDRVIHGKALSDKEHDDYDHEYDHDAFLGDEASEFDDLTPEESQRRLGLIVDKIDTDNDGQVSMDELQKWIKFTQTRLEHRS